MSALDEMNTESLKQPTLSIIIPTLNEAKNLPAVIKRIRGAACTGGLHS